VTGPPRDLSTGAFVVTDRKIVEAFEAAGQGQVFRYLDRLDFHGRMALFRSARNVDLDLVRRLADGSALAPPPAAPAPLEGPDVLRRADAIENHTIRTQAEEIGEGLLRHCKVACLTLAGGQGTRLGWGGPKGCYPIGPGDRTIFDVHAEGIARASEAHGRPIPWVVMVSPGTEEATRAWFRNHRPRGIDATQVRLVCQGTLPALDDGGRLLLEAEDRIAVNPDGHGGVFRALRTSGALGWLLNLGFEELSCCQVDNPLAPPVDVLFLGLHARARGQMSSKVFLKSDPAEKVGVMARIQGRPVVVEYTELAPGDGARRDAGGRLAFWAANMAAHALSLPFAAAVAFRGLPIHRVRKKVPFLDEQGRRVDPLVPNAWKHETFLFDALPMASHGVVLEVDRAVEFAPVKNAGGPDSPETARALLRAAGRW
jgi:UDP-N-acetylglucosamine/UDP-N-acetylgalactosamine diphosphorylase